MLLVSSDPLFVPTTSTPNNVNEITSQTGGANRTLTYDLNGSIISDGGTRTFEWDGANRLVAINYTGFTTRSEFTYDGLNRVVKIVEKTGTTINSTRKFVWHGQEKLEFRDATDAVTQRNHSQGQYVGTTAYFYTRDHLGSIREMFTGGGTVVARYDYDPYGRSTTILGTTPTDMNFTGLYRHSKGNLDLALYRAYDPDLGRWLSRDPIGEEGGLNLYAYVGNNPLSHTDRSGLMSDAELLNSINNEINPLAKLSPSCEAALKELGAALLQASIDMARYNPVTDWIGGHIQRYGPPTVPGGHAKELLQDFQRIERAVRRVKQECKDCNGQPILTPELMMEMMETVR